ncbi:MAG: hypothetical protein PWQ58_768 [Archaeoglobaceae archaeon]|nr:hypothetical protein [Archaeoglobaceae archaeon]
MDVDDAIVLFLGVWTVLSIFFAKSFDLFITLLLISVLIVLEVAGPFIRPEAKQVLKMMAYFMLAIFLIVVIRKAMEVLS